MNKRLMRKQLAEMLVKKRKYYVECEYLESTGTQYIDTGYKMTEGKTMTFNGNIMYTQSNGNANFFFGYRSVDSAEYRGDMRAFFVYGTSAPPAGRLAIRYGVNTDNSTSTISFNQRYNISFDGTNLKVDGTTFISVSAFYTPANYQNMYLFWCNCTGYYSADVAKFSGRIYNWQIFEDGVLVRDMIPVLDWNYTPCMYDKVSGELFYNAGTGDFSYGREIHYVYYLESTGTQYIDTGFKPSNTSGYYAKFAYSETTDESTVALGARTSGQDNRWWLNISTDFEGIVFGFGSYLSTQTEAPQNTVLEASCNLYNDRKYKYITKNWQGNISTTCPDVPFNAYLYAANVSGVLTLPVQNLKLYSVKFTDGSSLTRDFCPAIDENGVGFMFDKVTHTCFLNAGTGVFKYPAREVEYLESTGTQYINTGYIPNTNTECSIDFMFNTLDSTYRTPISVRTSDGAADSFTVSGASTTQNAYAFGLSSWWDGPGGCPKPVVGTKYNGTLKSGRATFGDVVGNAGTTITPSSLTAYMFARNANGTAANFFIGRIYDCQIKDNGTLTRDFVPVFMNGTAGMLEKLTGTLYTNQGTGSWTLGKVIEPEYE